MSYFLIPMSHKLTVQLGDRSYPIYIGKGFLGQLGALCGAVGRPGACLLVSDAHVERFYGAFAENMLKEAGFSVAKAIIPAGEESKSHQQLCALYETAAAHRMDRSSLVVALGGGVVGDLAGYMAATFLRGIRFVQVPTSLLAMVDSSVGGKTGVNLPQGKNLVGAFHQPSLVAADLDTLKSLPEREYRSGLAEVVKYGVIRDAEFFQWLEKRADVLGTAQASDLAEVVGRCCAIKAGVVGLDERESGLRAILNFGHTLGHAIEKVGGYGVWLHGEAVAMGMAYAARLSEALAGFPSAEADRLEHLLSSLGLPARCPPYDWAAIRQAMSSDKKSAASIPRFVLVERMGAAAVGREAPEELLKETWERMRAG